MYCIQCGSVIADAARFCMKCGNPMAAPPNAGTSVPPPLPQSATIAPTAPAEPVDVSRRDSARRLLVGKKADYYLERWSKIERSQNKTSWNWMACLWPVFWMAYRKMYLYAAIFGGIFVAESILQEILKYPNQISQGITVGMWVASGMMGNYLYKLYIDRQIDGLYRRKHEYSDAELAQHGGTSIVGVIVFAAVFVVVVGLAVSLLP